MRKIKWTFNNISGRIEDASNDGAVIATLAATECDQTGQLIAAAPELLEALTRLTSDNEMSGHIHGHSMDQARAVIMKATQS